MRGSAVDDVMLYGRGAGDFPTASAIISDIIYASKAAEHRYMSFMNEQGKVSDEVEFDNNWETGFYLRLTLADAPGALAKVATVLGNNDVSIESVIQGDIDENGASVIFATHKTHELSVEKALEQLRQTDVVREIASVIRVER